VRSLKHGVSREIFGVLGLSLLSGTLFERHIFGGLGDITVIVLANWIFERRNRLFTELLKTNSRIFGLFVFDIFALLTTG
jgi:hypothetical protein